MYLETPRLELHPMAAGHLRMAISSIPDAVAAMGLEIGPLPRADIRMRQKIYRAKFDLLQSYPKAWLLSTAWEMVSKSDGLIAGELGFKGPPFDGDIEIGYGTHENFRNKGYMTEAVKALCAFAFSQAEYKVLRILALTLKNNLPSHNVLMKCGFERESRSGRMIRWTLSPHAAARGSFALVE